MKLSEQTLSVLKNFNTINQSVLVKPGNTIRTISGQRNVFARASVAETFPAKFAIFELSKFLGTVSLFKDPDFEFFDDHLKITEGKTVSRYTYADESMIVVPPDKEIDLPSKDIYFELSEKDLSTIQKAIGILQVPELSVVGEDGTIYVKAINNKNPSSDQYSIAVGVTDQSFNAIFKSEYLKFMPGNYKINISNKGYAQFESDGLSYWIAAEHTSKFGV